MDRLGLFNSIEERLNILAGRIKSRGALNLLDLHVHSENFFLHFLNLVFGWELKNLNAIDQNAPGLDLVDIHNKLVVQVSATHSKQKVESALGKVPAEYQGFSFKFVPIVVDAGMLRTKTFLNPHGMKFNPVEDILDIVALLRVISPFEADRMDSVYEFLKKELRWDPDQAQIETNLADLINILAQEDWSKVDLTTDAIPFDIDQKIDFNGLKESREIIDDLKLYHSRLNGIYAEYTKMGVNKTLTVTMKLRSFYQAAGRSSNPDDRFSAVIRETIEFIKSSGNYKPINEEELELCVKIITVDAFIRCKIFSRPPKVENAHP